MDFPDISIFFETFRLTAMRDTRTQHWVLEVSNAAGTWTKSRPIALPVLMELLNTATIDPEKVAAFVGRHFGNEIKTQ